MNIPAPVERLRFFQKQLEISENDFALLQEKSQIFMQEKSRFSNWFYEYFQDFPHTRSILESESHELRLKKIWEMWLEQLFSSNGGDDFFLRHWRSGLKHVQTGVDHRYINMAYGLVRRFLHKVISEKLTGNHSEQLSEAVDKVLDLCTLIETDAFITSTTQCDHEVIRGIAHQVRNPLTVIGGNIMLLQKKIDSDDPRRAIYDAMLMEARRMERMVKNVVVYNEVFQKEPTPSPCDLRLFIQESLMEFSAQHPDVAVENLLDDRHFKVFVDKDDLRTILFHVLQNAFEAAAEADSPQVRISSRLGASKAFLEVQVYNNGPIPSQEAMDQIFTPFYSTKAMGTGFGLPIVKLAARKNEGNFKIEVVQGKGIFSLISLPFQNQ